MQRRSGQPVERYAIVRAADVDGGRMGSSAGLLRDLDRRPDQEGRRLVKGALPEVLVAGDVAAMAAPAPVRAGNADAGPCQRAAAIDEDVGVGPVLAVAAGVEEVEVARTPDPQKGVLRRHDADRARGRAVDHAPRLERVIAPLAPDEPVRGVLEYREARERGGAARVRASWVSIVQTKPCWRFSSRGPTASVDPWPAFSATSIRRAPPRP